MKLRARQMALTGLMFGCGLAWGQAFDMSESDSRQFQFFRPIDKAYLRPGNDGITLLKEPPGKPDSGLNPWQDEYCDTRSLVLDAPEYDIRPGDAGSSAAYWGRLDHYAGQMTIVGSRAVWIIDENFLRAMAGRPALRGELLEHLQKYRQREMLVPAVVFRGGANTAEAEGLYGELIAAGNLAGAHFTGANKIGGGDCRWGFVILDEEALPLEHGAESAAGWAHHTFGQVPVVVSPRHPDFLRDTRWLVTGMAGLAFRPLAPDTATSDALHLRADTVFLNRFQGTMALRPRASAPGVIMELASDNPAQPEAAWLLESAGGSVEVPLGSFAGVHGVAASWFRPDTDENILLPPSAPVPVQTITAPGEGQWVYSVQTTAQPYDRATTITAIREWED